jgi:hypothetical protein
MRTRRLTLRREAIAALTTDELAVVAGAAGPTGPEPTPPIFAPRTVQYNDCVSDLINKCDLTQSNPRCF